MPAAHSRSSSSSLRAAPRRLRDWGPVSLPWPVGSLPQDCALAARWGPCPSGRTATPWEVSLQQKKWAEECLHHHPHHVWKSVAMYIIIYLVKNPGRLAFVASSPEHPPLFWRHIPRRGLQSSAYSASIADQLPPTVRMGLGSKFTSTCRPNYPHLGFFYCFLTSFLTFIFYLWLHIPLWYTASSISNQKYVLNSCGHQDPYTLTHTYSMPTGCHEDPTPHARIFLWKF